MWKMFLPISAADESGEFPTAKPFKGREITQLFLNRPTPSTIHHHHYQFIKKKKKKKVSSSVNNLVVYADTSGPRCISVQLQCGMSQLAVAADEGSLSASRGTDALSS